ncbi:hypothetical protein DIPPA_16893 [Diplonema papillatum]|nr:hypothetical protein DIPPA_16893 [Diplonema papillatum]|eukprot:gene16418-25170_t
MAAAQGARMFGIPRAISGFAGGFSMGTVYSYACSESLPARPIGRPVPACDKILYAIADDDTYWGIGLGVAALCGGPATFLGLAAGSLGATKEEYDFISYGRAFMDKIQGRDSS